MILSILIIFRGLKYLFAKIYEMSEEKNLKRNNNDQIIILNKIEGNNDSIIPKNNPPKKTQIKNVQVKFTNYLDSPNSINKFFKTKIHYCKMNCNLLCYLHHLIFYFSSSS